jgi:hypothetical protein
MICFGWFLLTCTEEEKAFARSINADQVLGDRLMYSSNETTSKTAAASD